MSLLTALRLPLPGGTAPKSSRAQAQAIRLSHAASAWIKTHQEADRRIQALKTAIVAHYADSHNHMAAEIESGAQKLDAVLDEVDHELAEVMHTASAIADDAARTNELKKAKDLLMQHIAYVAKEQLIAHMDSNPFGVKTDLKALLRKGLTDAASAIS